MRDAKYYLRLKVITPQGKRVECEVIEVVFPAHDGLTGVLSLHAPMVNRLGMGILRYTDFEDKLHRLFIEKGFVRIGENEVRILARNAVSAEEITQAEAQNMLRRAEIMPTSTMEEIHTREAALQRARHFLALTKS